MLWEASFITKVNGIGVQPKNDEEADLRTISKNLSYVLIFEIYIFQSFALSFN